MQNRHWLGGVLCALAMSVNVWAAEVDTSLTKTRPEMKKRIEGLKLREARIPLPPLTAEEIASGRRSVNNGRLRSIYLPESWQSSNNAARSQGRNTAGQGAQTDRQRLDQMQQAPDFGF